MSEAEEAPAPKPLVYGVASALSPMVRRIVATNPGKMTGPGTNTYLVGIDEIAVIDPGPDDAAHLDGTGLGLHIALFLLLALARPFGPGGRGDRLRPRVPMTRIRLVGVPAGQRAEEER